MIAVFLILERHIALIKTMGNQSCELNRSGRHMSIFRGIRVTLNYSYAWKSI